MAPEPGGSFGSPADIAAAKAIGEISREDSRSVEAELAQAGIVDSGGNISSQWVLAAWISAFAPVKVTTVAQTEALSSHCELALAAGRGVGASYRRTLSRTAGSVEVAEVPNVVEVSFFKEEHAWAAVARSLPALSELQASASEASGFDARRTTVAPGGGTSSSESAGRGGVPAALANARCTVRMEVTASAAEAEPSRYSADVWALAGQLYSLRTAADPATLLAVEVPPGDICREFAWRILGVRGFLASASAQAA
ncbi:hypothetical protein [Arthrobacter sp. ISL-72]|uniref:hypothetical protein n=1 Tax=Arthrobacter sp. ISL-72 TaxID=2819114 RepID=UPI001BEBD53F|nr:hypothetical protein [Arthrobacter sp. ISL-72]MBT2596049.1 hypothetical protein [Arthrobacter sp. ISL-72]